MGIKVPNIVKTIKPNDRLSFHINSYPFCQHKLYTQCKRTQRKTFSYNNRTKLKYQDLPVQIASSEVENRHKT